MPRAHFDPGKAGRRESGLLARRDGMGVPDLHDQQDPIGLGATNDQVRDVAAWAKLQRLFALNKYGCFGLDQPAHGAPSDACMKPAPQPFVGLDLERQAADRALMRCSEWISHSVSRSRSSSEPLPAAVLGSVRGHGVLGWLERLMLGFMSLPVQSKPVPEPSREASLAASLPAQAQAAAVVLAYLANTQLAARSKAFEVLRELATQTQARVREGKSADIATVSLKAGVAPDVLKEPSAWLSPHWTRLLKEEQQWGEGMAAAAQREGLAFVPRLDKVQGNPTHYRILAVPVPAEGTEDPVALVPAGGIFYTPESVAAPGAFMSKALRAGSVPWTAPARWSLFALIMGSLFFTVFCAWLLIYFGSRVTRPVSPADITTLTVFLLLVGSLVSVFRFFDELFDLRIVMAPTLLAPLSKDNVTLELRPSTAEVEGQLVFARYTSTCPICSGSIELFSGGKEFPGRIIGRCRRSAREHVYSFDVAGKVGRPLRLT